MLLIRPCIDSEVIQTPHKPHCRRDRATLRNAPAAVFGDLTALKDAKGVRLDVGVKVRGLLCCWSDIIAAVVWMSLSVLPRFDRQVLQPDPSRPFIRKMNIPQGRVLVMETALQDQPPRDVAMEVLKHAPADDPRVVDLRRRDRVFRRLAGRMEGLQVSRVPSSRRIPIRKILTTS